jgi:hypothetical protein
VGGGRAGERLLADSSRGRPVAVTLGKSRAQTLFLELSSLHVCCRATAVHGVRRSMHSVTVEHRVHTHSHCTALCRIMGCIVLLSLCLNCKGMQLLSACTSLYILLLCFDPHNNCCYPILACAGVTSATRVRIAGSWKEVV